MKIVRNGNVFTITSNLLATETTIQRLTYNGVVTDIDFLDVVDSTYVLTTIEPDAEGLYTLEITAGQTEEELSIEKSCIFVRKNMLCDLVELVSKQRVTELELDYYLLAHAHECECSCDHFTEIYNRVKHELERNC